MNSTCLSACSSLHCLYKYLSLSLAGKIRPCKIKFSPRFTRCGWVVWNILFQRSNSKISADRWFWRRKQRERNDAMWVSRLITTLLIHSFVPPSPFLCLPLLYKTCIRCWQPPDEEKSSRLKALRKGRGGEELKAMQKSVCWAKKQSSWWENPPSFSFGVHVCIYRFLVILTTLYC